jgi:hypothetical protein
MKVADVRRKTSAMRFVNRSYPPGPYRFYNREYLVIAYRTDSERCARRRPRFPTRSSARSTSGREPADRRLLQRVLLSGWVDAAGHGDAVNLATRSTRRSG